MWPQLLKLANKESPMYKTWLRVAYAFSVLASLVVQFLVQQSIQMKADSAVVSRSIDPMSMLFGARPSTTQTAVCTPLAPHHTPPSPTAPLRCGWSLRLTISPLSLVGFVDW